MLSPLVPSTSLVLRTKTVTVVAFDADLHALLQSMREIMRINGGVGLAANQIGIPWSVAVALLPNGLIELVNPRITSENGRQVIRTEGCLSFPELAKHPPIILRPMRITCTYFDRAGNQCKTGILSGKWAQLISHEIDHLEGKTLLSRTVG